MTKKAKVKATKTEETALATVPSPVSQQILSVVSDIKINEGHIVDIAVADIEKRLYIKKGKLQKTQRILQKKASDLETQSKSLAQQQASDHFDPKLEKAVKALIDMGFKVACSAKGSVVQKDGKNMICVNLMIFKSGGYSQETVTKYLEPKKQLKDVLLSIVEIGRELIVTGEELSDAMIKIGQMASTERQARASLAKTVLSSTEEGRKLVESMEGSV